MLLQKMLRDMKLNITQFVSIFIMSILGVLIYSGINAEWYGMKSEVDKYYEETHLADIWVMGSNFSKEDIEKVKKLPGTTNAISRLTFDSSVNGEANQTLRIIVIEENSISAPKVIEGENLGSTKDGLWLDSSFAKENKLKIGDKISFEVMGKQVNKTILGLIIHPEYVHNVKDDSALMPNPKSFGFAFLFSSSLPFESETPYNQLLITKDKSVDQKAMVLDIEALFSDRYSIVLDRNTHPSVAQFNSEIEQNKAMGGVFPVVFFLIAALTMLTTMTRMTSNQRTQIGTLKALGFSRGKILRHYVSYGIWIGILGGVIGLIAGPLTIPPILFNMQKTIYTLPNWSAVISPSSFIAVALSVLCCGASSYIACRKQLKEVPAATLRPSAPKIKGHSKFEKSKLWHRLGFSAQWNLRDVLRSKIRSSMAVVGVMGCTALLLFGLGLKDAVNGFSSWMYKDLNVYENKINLKEDASKEAISEISKLYKGQWIQETNIELKFDGVKESGSLTVLDEGEEILFEDEKRNRISLPDKGVALTYKMAELLNVNIGGTIQWRAYGEKDWLESRVTAIYRTPMGQGISMKKEVYEESNRVFKPTALLTRDKVNGVEKMPVVKNVQDKNKLMDSINDMLESMKMIIAILVLAAVILGSVVLYNLGALSFTERIRELATLKVLGFLPKQIRSLLLLQNIWLTVIGIIIGIPTGYGLVTFMLSTMPSSTDFIADISLFSMIISILGTFIVSVLVSVVLSRKVKEIDMVSALKSVE